MKGEFRNLTDRSEQELAELRDEVADHETVEDIFRWLRSSGSHDGTEDVIVQDEFTHDGIFPYRDGLYVVYGLT